MFKTSHAAVIVIAAGTMLASGCATKKYVKNTVDPVSDRLSKVGSQVDQQGQTLDATRKDVDKNGQDIAATRETAKAADARAGDAMNAANAAGTKADAAGAKADENARNLSDLKGVVANLDDYKPATNAVINFKFGSDVLTKDGKAELDKFAENKTTWKRYFIAVEGFTDKTGSDSYNDALSKRRADKVTQYIVSKYDIPVYRIHQIGLGKEKPVEDGHGKQARAKNRRVEVTVYSADSALSASAAPPAAQ